MKPTKFTPNNDDNDNDNDNNCNCNYRSRSNRKRHSKEKNVENVIQSNTTTTTTTTKTTNDEAKKASTATKAEKHRLQHAKDSKNSNNGLELATSLYSDDSSSNDDDHHHSSHSSREKNQSWRHSREHIQRDTWTDEGEVSSSTNSSGSTKPGAVREGKYDGDDDNDDDDDNNTTFCEQNVQDDGNIYSNQLFTMGGGDESSSPFMVIAELAPNDDDIDMIASERDKLQQKLDERQQQDNLLFTEAEIVTRPFYAQKRTLIVGTITFVILIVIVVVVSVKMAKKNKDSILLTLSPTASPAPSNIPSFIPTETDIFQSPGLEGCMDIVEGRGPRKKADNVTAYGYVLEVDAYFTTSTTTTTPASTDREDASTTTILEDSVSDALLEEMQTNVAPRVARCSESNLSIVLCSLRSSSATGGSSSTITTPSRDAFSKNIGKQGTATITTTTTKGEYRMKNGNRILVDDNIQDNQQTKNLVQIANVLFDALIQQDGSGCEEDIPGMECAAIQFEIFVFVRGDQRLYPSDIDRILFALLKSGVGIEAQYFEELRPIYMYQILVFECAGAIQPEPTATPSYSPTKENSDMPSDVPSQYPTGGGNGPPRYPTPPPVIPHPPSSSQYPSNHPTVSVIPCVTPSTTPSTTPSEQPSTSPSVAPSTSPSVAPSTLPSVAPSVSPSQQPSAQPTRKSGGIFYVRCY